MRAAARFAFLLFATLAAPIAQPADPSSGALTDTNLSLTYSTVAEENATFDPPTCGACDDFALNIELPEGYIAAHPGGVITITTAWLDEDDDFDLYLVDGGGNYVKTEANTGPSPETFDIFLHELPADTTSFTIRLVLYAKGSGENAGTATTTVVLEPGPDDPCVLPGVRVLIEPSGDQAISGSAQQDVQWVSIAELGEDIDTLAFTLKVRELSGDLTPSAQWGVFFNSPDGTTYWVNMATDAGRQVSFNYGTRSGTSNATVGRADAGAYTADGRVTIRVKRNKVGDPGPGDTLTGIFGRTYVQAGVLLNTTDTAPNAAPFNANYTIVGNTFCGTPPPETPCELPGVKMLDDPSGDFSPNGNSAHDIQAVYVAELGANEFATTFSMKVADLSSIPPNTNWNIFFSGTDGVVYFASMNSDPSSAVEFNYGHIDENDFIVTDGSANAGSYTKSGFIHVTVATANIGSPGPGDSLTGFEATTSQLAGASGSGITFTADSTDPGMDYEIVGNDFCPAPPTGSICVAPGVEIQSDAAGDAPSDQHDVLSILLAQPPEEGTDLVLTMKVADLSTIPPQSQWHIEFVGPDNARRSVYMDTFTATPEFFVADVEVDGTATFYGGNAVAIDGSASDDGTIEMKVPRGRVGTPLDGDTFNSVGTVVFQQAGLLLARLDSTETTATFTVADNAFCTNAPPLATLLADATSGEAPLGINFSVSGSDAEGELQSFSLNFGDGQSLDNQPFTAETVIVPHTFQEAGSYTVSLSVADETGLQSTNLAEVIIVVTGPPVARAGDDFSILEGEVGMIDGSNSNNGGAGDLNYSWSQQSGVIATLSGSDSSTASFTAPDVCEPQDLIFQLSVSNAAGMDTDEVVVTVENINQPPLANAGSNKVVDQTARVRLDGSGTSDPDTCQELSYQWVQYQGPLVELANADQANATFEAPTVGGDTVLGFRLIVTDSEGATSNSAVLVTVTARIIGETKVGGLPPFGLILLTLFGALAKRRR